MKERMKLKKGLEIKGFSSDVPGTWRIISLRPFKVEARQGNKRWIINVSRREFEERLRAQLLYEKLKII